ncbi:MAG: anaerobic ribonucleoside-triphosphate reductase activating protein [Paludibacteraceae bacterium]|nr:anaerobic ribonucleoside-triphosphate reductase activating protein [Paludibacteraceae bacterium]
MVKVASYDVVFQEIPGEVTLALNLSNCPCHCPGCHSPHLAEDIGEPLDEELLDGLIERYKGLITCVAFMGGDAEPEEVARLAAHVKQSSLKTAWYSGRMNMPKDGFDYVKLGGYVESLGGLKSPTTNQRLYKRVGDNWTDITSSFWNKNL